MTDKPETARRRQTTYWIIGIGLTIGLLLGHESGWRGGVQLHTVMEAIATLLALMVGAMALVRYYSKKESVFLLIGAGFLGTGFLDGFHAIVTSAYFKPMMPSDLPSLIPWSWVASRQFLSILMVLSWVAWVREARLGAAGRISERTVYMGTIIFTLASFLFFAFVPLPRAYYPEIFFHRPEEFLPALFFLLALIGYLRKGHWRRDAFEHWLVLSLIVGFIGQAVFMSHSGKLFDYEFDVAHTLKKVSYICVFTGLLISMYVVFRREVEIASSLKDSEQRVRGIVDNVVDGIITIDERGTIETFNPAAERIFGYAAEEAIGRNVKFLMPAPHLDNHDDYLANYLETGDAKIIGTGREVEGLRKEGSTFPLSLAISDVRLGDKRMFIGVTRDITLSKQAEEELHAAKKQAEDANRAKSNFLAMMSHEIRTPLNGVLGVLGLLQDTKLDGEQRAYADTGRNSAEALLDIINDILDFSKMEAGKLDLEITGFDLAAMVQSVAEILAPRAGAKNIGLNADVSPHTPTRVLGDSGRIRQILLNLAGNAVKFTDKGSVTITVSAAKSTPKGARFRFEVADTGIGIPQEKHHELFNEFTTLDSFSSRRHEGTGLGLTISKRLVAVMGGAIGFSSVSGKGSTFWFEVELATRPGEAQRPDIAQKIQARMAPARKLRILLAEDNRTNRMIVVAMLRKAGHYIDAVADGAEAVEAVRTLPYDAVLMDVAMPEMDGLEATAAIRSLPDAKAGIPIIAMTAHAMEGDREQFLAAGMNDYLRKPASRDQILDVLERWTSEGEAPVMAPSPEAARSGNAPVFDKAVLVQLAEEVNPDIIPDLGGSFLSDLESRVEKIIGAVQAADLETLELETHTLCSSAAAFGAMELHHLARNIEAACGAKDRDRALELGATIAGVAKEASLALTGYLNTKSR